MARRPGLGRGLDALIPGSDFETSSDQPATSGVMQVAVTDIRPNPWQPRHEFNEAELNELAASIRAYGIIQPLIISPDEQPDKYILIAGERRWRAAQLVGMTHVPVIMRSVNEQEQLELALIENVQREDLSVMERAEAFKRLSEDFNLSHDEIAQRVGKSRVTVTNTLRLLNLPDLVKKALANEEISEGHARALLALTSPQAQIAALETVIRLSFSVRQTEELVRKMSGQRTQKTVKAETPAEIKDLEARLQNHFGTKVNLNHRKNGGSIIIFYYSDEELNNLLDNVFGS